MPKNLCSLTGLELGKDLEQHDQLISYDAISLTLGVHVMKADVT